MAQFDSKKKYLNWIFALILLVSGLLSFCIISEDHDWGDDFAAYILQAKSILTGDLSQALEITSFMREKSSAHIGPLAAPWGFPLLLAITFIFFGESMLSMKFLLLGFYMLFLLVLWLGFHKKTDNLNRILLVALFAGNPIMLAYQNAIMTDIPFLFFSTTTIFLIHAIIVTGRQIFSIRIDLVLLGALIASSFFIRSNGILLLPVLLVAQSVEYLLSKEKRVSKNALLHAVLPYTSFFVLVMIWRLIFPAGGAGHLSAMLNFSALQLTANLNFYLNLPADFFGSGWVYQLFYGMSLPLVAAGIFQAIRKDYPFVLYSALTLLAYALWPLPNQGLRYILPVLPFFVYFLLKGAVYFREVSQGKVRYIGHFFVGFLGFIIFSQMVDSFQYAKTNIRRDRIAFVHGPYAQSSQEMLAYIKANIPEDAVVVFRKPRAMWYYAGRRAIVESTRAALQKGDYICYDLQKRSRQLSKNDISAFESDGRIELKYKNSGYKIFKVAPKVL